MKYRIVERYDGRFEIQKSLDNTNEIWNWVATRDCIEDAKKVMKNEVENIRSIRSMRIKQVIEEVEV